MHEANDRTVKRGATTWSFLSLLLANAVTVYLAVTQQWSIGTILWTYWFQSVVIGVFQWFKISDIRKFTTENFRVNHQPVDPTPETKRTVLWYFPTHYGLFHLGYAVFLFEIVEVDFFAVLLGGAVFLANHAFSYYENREQDSRRVRNIGGMMFFPYIRILPMHLIIAVAATINGAVLLPFMLMKSLADLLMHVVEHKV